MPLPRQHCQDTDPLQDIPAGPDIAEMGDGMRVDATCRRFSGTRMGVNGECPVVVV